jgi:HEAT repeat protein
MRHSVAPALLLALVAAAPLAAQGDAPLLGRTVAEWTGDLANPQPVVRQAAAEALARAGREASRAVPALAGLVVDPDVAVRRTAIRTLGALGAVASRSERTLWQAWRDDDALVAADAGIALLAVAPGTASRFRALLDTSDARTRARAAAALSRATPARGTIHALRDRLADDDARVRGAALAALDALDATPGATTAARVGDAILRETRTLPLLADGDAAARVQVALRVLARAGRDARGAARALQRLVWDAPPATRTEAARVLGRVPGEGDAALATALAAGGTEVREAALAGLLADRERRRDLGAVTDTLRRMAAPIDSARAADLVTALGYVGRRSRAVERALAEVVQRAPALAAAVQDARRRLALGF